MMRLRMVAALACLAVLASFLVLGTSAEAAVSTTAVVGTGTSGYAGDGGAATAAQINWPTAMTSLPSGGYVFVDTGNCAVRMVSAAGVISTVVGTGHCGYTDLHDPLTGNLVGATATTMNLQYPNGVAVLPGGDLAISENARLLYYHTVDQTVTWLAGSDVSMNNGDGPALQQHIDAAASIAASPAGDIYFVDNHCIRTLTAGNIVTIAGQCGRGGYGDGPDGVAGLNTKFYYPGQIVATGTQLYIADTVNCRVRSVDLLASDHLVSTVAGMSQGNACTSTGDGGPATGATVDRPQSLALAGDGSLAIAETGSANNVRVIDPAGNISSVAAYAYMTTLLFDPADNLLVGTHQPQQIVSLAGIFPPKVCPPGQTGTPPNCVIPPPPPPPTPEPLHIVALGDSVAAGEGLNYGWHYVLDKGGRDGRWVETFANPLWTPVTNPGQISEACHQSPGAYPVLVAAQLNAKLTDLACTGASAPAGILGPEPLVGVGNQVAQLGLSGDISNPPNAIYDAAKPDVVLLTVGANDIRFSDYVDRCYEPPINPFTRRVYGACNSTKNTNEVKALLAQQKSNLTAVLQEIVTRGQAAGKVPTVYLTTYYDPFPAQYSRCRDTTLSLNQLGAGITRQEFDWLKSNLNQLNVNTRQVAQVFTNVRIVEAQNTLQGHQLCSNDPWVYGPSIRAQFGQSQNPAPFHPSTSGQKSITEAVIARIQ
jgi:lysophospholipase L1-like esterase